MEIDTLTLISYEGNEYTVPATILSFSTILNGNI